MSLLPLGGAGSKWLLCACLQEMDWAVVERVPLLTHMGEWHLETPLHGHTTFTTCINGKPEKTDNDCVAESKTWGINEEPLTSLSAILDMQSLYIILNALVTSNGALVNALNERQNENLLLPIFCLRVGVLFRLAALPEIAPDQFSLHAWREISWLWQAGRCWAQCQIPDEISQGFVTSLSLLPGRKAQICLHCWGNLSHGFQEAACLHAVMNTSFVPFGMNLLEQMQSF